VRRIAASHAPEHHQAAAPDDIRLHGSAAAAMQKIVIGSAVPSHTFPNDDVLVWFLTISN
jgi:hypothetical protein